MFRRYLYVLLTFITIFKTSTQALYDIHGPFTSEEYQEMREVSQSLVNYIIDNNLYENKMTKALNQTKADNHTDSFICKTCLKTFTSFHNFLDKKYGLSLLKEFLANICSPFLEFKICKSAIDLYAPVIVDSLIEHYMDAEYICTNNHLCKFRHYQDLNADDYAKELLKDKPMVEEIFNYTISNEDDIKVLQVTDIHTDIFYTEV